VLGRFESSKNQLKANLLFAELNATHICLVNKERGF
jgi:hypothetical protein